MRTNEGGGKEREGERRGGDGERRGEEGGRKRKFVNDVYLQGLIYWEKYKNSKTEFQEVTEEYKNTGIQFTRVTEEYSFSIHSIKY